MFDKLEEFGIVVGDSIKMCMPDYHEKIEVKNYKINIILYINSKLISN